jgi:hypothetical protein
MHKCLIITHPLKKQTASKDNFIRHLKMHESKKQALTLIQAQKVQNAL